MWLTRTRNVQEGGTGTMNEGLDFRIRELNWLELETEADCSQRDPTSEGYIIVRAESCWQRGELLRPWGHT
jgi:hypothetical protein